MILVTGATGHFGRAAIEYLLSKGISPGDIAALARSTEKAAGIKDKGIKIIAGDYDHYESLVTAFQDIDQLLFVSSNDISRRVVQQENVVKAAQAAGVKHVIYTSFERKNETAASPIAAVAEAHLATEKWLQESGLSYTILRNNIYMDLIPVFIGDKILESGIVYLPAGEEKAGFALRSEMAEATANILVSGGHAGKTYYFSNVETYGYADVAAVISEVSGKNIVYTSPSAEEYKKTLLDAGVPEVYVGMFSAFALAHAAGEFDASGNDLERLLGRRPASLREYLQTVYAPGK